MCGMIFQIDRNVDAPYQKCSPQVKLNIHAFELGVKDPAKVNLEILFLSFISTLKNIFRKFFLNSSFLKPLLTRETSLYLQTHFQSFRCSFLTIRCIRAPVYFRYTRGSRNGQKNPPSDLALGHTTLREMEDVWHSLEGPERVEI